MNDVEIAKLMAVAASLGLAANVSRFVNANVQTSNNPSIVSNPVTTTSTFSLAFDNVVAVPGSYDLAQLLSAAGQGATPLYNAVNTAITNGGFAWAIASGAVTNLAGAGNDISLKFSGITTLFSHSSGVAAHTPNVVNLVPFDTIRLSAGLTLLNLSGQIITYYQ